MFRDCPSDMLWCTVIRVVSSCVVSSCVTLTVDDDDVSVHLEGVQGGQIRGGDARSKLTSSEGGYLYVQYDLYYMYTCDQHVKFIKLIYLTYLMSK